MQPGRMDFTSEGPGGFNPTAAILQVGSETRTRNLLHKSLPAILGFFELLALSLFFARRQQGAQPKWPETIDFTRSSLPTLPVPVPESSASELRNEPLGSFAQRSH